MKLHIGCGGKILEGYINAVVSKKKGADIAFNAEEKFPFKDNTFSEIYSEHFIEHLNKENVKKFYRECYRTLKKGGKVITECPDILKVAKLIIKNKNNFKILQNKPLGIRGLYGILNENSSRHAFHKWGYTPFTLKTIMESVGLLKIKVLDGYEHGWPERDMRVIGFK